MLSALIGILFKRKLKQIFCTGTHRPLTFLCRCSSTAKSAIVPWKSSPSSTFSPCSNFSFSLRISSLWLEVPSHKVPHWWCTPDPLGEPHDDVFTLFFSPAVLPRPDAGYLYTFQAPKARITSFRLLILVGQVIQVYVFCDRAWGFFGLLVLPLLVAFLG